MFHLGKMDGTYLDIPEGATAMAPGYLNVSTDLEDQVFSSSRNIKQDNHRYNNPSNHLSLFYALSEDKQSSSTHSAQH